MRRHRQNQIKLLILYGSPGWTARASNFNDLKCQPDVKGHFDTHSVFPALSNLIVEGDDGRFLIGPAPDALGPILNYDLLHNHGGIAAPTR